MHSHCVTRGYELLAVAGSPSPVPVFRWKEEDGRGQGGGTCREFLALVDPRDPRDPRRTRAPIRLDTRCAAGAGAIERTGAADAPQCLAR